MEEQILFADRFQFRDWLLNNSCNSKGIWLLFSKDKKTPSIKANEALEEALCFGWIDGQISSIDDSMYRKKFTPRKKASKWSEKNKELAEKLIEIGIMTEYGQAAIDLAKKEGIWVTPKPKPVTEEQIDILDKLLVGHEPAYTNFLKMSQSVKVTYTLHYLSAKAEETKG